MATNRQERFLMRQRGAGTHTLQNLDFGLAFPATSNAPLPAQLSSRSTRSRRTPQSDSRPPSGGRQTQTTRPGRSDSHDSATDSAAKRSHSRRLAKGTQEDPTSRANKQDVSATIRDSLSSQNTRLKASVDEAQGQGEEQERFVDNVGPGPRSGQKRKRDGADRVTQSSGQRSEGSETEPTQGTHSQNQSSSAVRRSGRLRSSALDARSSSSIASSSPTTKATRRTSRIASKTPTTLRNEQAKQPSSEDTRIQAQLQEELASAHLNDRGHSLEAVEEEEGEEQEGMDELPRPIRRQKRMRQSIPAPSGGPRQVREVEKSPAAAEEEDEDEEEPRSSRRQTRAKASDASTTILENDQEREEDQEEAPRWNSRTNRTGKAAPATVSTRRRGRNKEQAEHEAQETRLSPRQAHAVNPRATERPQKHQPAQEAVSKRARPSQRDSSPASGATKAAARPTRRAPSEPTSPQRRQRRTRSKKAAAIPITVYQHRQSHASRREEETADHIPSTQKFIHSSAPTAVDVLSQLTKEFIGERASALAEDSANANKRNSGRSELRRKKKYLQAFRDGLDERFFELTEALNYHISLEVRVRQAKREKSKLREELLQLRREREKVALEMDEVRREHGERAAKAQSLNDLNSLLSDISLAVERGRAEQAARRPSSSPHSTSEASRAPESDLQSLLEQVSANNSSASDLGGLLHSVKGFNSFLEMIAGGLEARV